MKWLPLAMFLLSVVGLIAVVLRSRLSMRWIGYAMLHVVTAAVLLYLLGLAESYIHFRIPINGVTVLTVGILGIPGLLLLAGVKYFIVG